MGERFVTTRWSVVMAAREAGSVSRSREALAALCETYWSPLYAFIRHQGYGVEDAADLTQAYFAQLLEKRYLEAVHPSKGRFRSFLLVSLRHFLSDARDRQRALKRGGGLHTVSLDAEEAERDYRSLAVEHLTPESVFERRWAQTLVRRALLRLKDQPAGSAEARRFERLSEFLIDGSGGTRYREVAAELGMSEGAVKVAVHRLRRRFGETLRQEVADTVATPDQVDDELHHLLAVLH